MPALAQDSGNSLTYWENKLKLTVMPDDFPPIETVIDGREFVSLPSIKTLGVKKMNQMVEGSVAQCHEWGFLWVTLPDKELRK